MHKIDTQTSVNGEFTDGNPSTGVKATQLNADWFNSVQREICNAVVKFGKALSKEDDMQLWKVISALGVKTFSPWEGDFGGWPGNSVIVMDAVETVYFPVPDRCPKNAIAIVSVPWMESDTSLTVAQNEGSSSPLFRGNIGLVFFDANGYASEVKNMPVSATGIPLLFLYAMEGKLETLTVNGEAKLPGATFTPATSSGGVPVAKFAYLKVLESLDVEKGMTVKGEAEFESVKADSLEVEKAKVSDMETSKISSPKTTLTVAAVLDALGVKGNVTTDMIVPKTAGQPISVIGSLSISGNVSLTGETAAVSAKSVATERLAYSKLSLKDAGFAKAPALPYFIDDSYSYDGDLSRQCSEAPEGGRVTFVNATGSERNYHFTGGANGKSGYFTLKNGHAVDLLVLETTSSTQVALVPIGINFSTVD